MQRELCTWGDVQDLLGVRQKRAYLHINEKGKSPQYTKEQGVIGSFLPRFAKAVITLGFCWDGDGDRDTLSTALLLLCRGCRGLVDVPRHCTVQSLQNKAPDSYLGVQIPPSGLLHSLHQPSRCLLVLLAWMGPKELGSQAHGNVSPRGASPLKPCVGNPPLLLWGIFSAFGEAITPF